MSPFYPKSRPIYDFFPILLYDLRGGWVQPIKMGCSFVEKFKESIKIILIRRKNHYEPVLPQISTNIRFSFNIALWFKRRLSAANQNGVLFCKKVQEIDWNYFATPQKSLWARFTPNLEQYPIFFFNIAQWFERRLSAANQNGAILSKKVQGIDLNYVDTPQKSLWARFTPNLDQYSIFFQFCSVIWEEAKCGQSKRGVLM